MLPEFKKYRDGWDIGNKRYWIVSSFLFSYLGYINVFKCLALLCFMLLSIILTLNFVK